MSAHNYYHPPTVLQFSRDGTCNSAEISETQYKYMEDISMDPAAQMELEALALVKPIDEATERGDSDIQRFYKDTTLFITGGTGFIGKQLIEKLFRSCEIKKAFVLIRPKKDQSTEQRLKSMLSDPVFAPVLKKKPDLETRIVCVEGDVTDIRLGISDSDWNTIVEEVNVIFHEAATVRFDEHIRTATLANVRGTREALRLGKACKQLRSYVHVSTAYCHATSNRYGREVLEQFYQTPVPPDTIVTLAETVDKDRLDKITPSLISGWPNTYTFTKAIAEELVRAEAENLPVCIVRPSIVLQTYREPVPGWLDLSCVYGPSGIVLGVGLGVLHVAFVDNTVKLSFVPVDYVNNATIAAGWETAVKKTPEVKIYNISTTKCGVTFRNISIPMRGSKVRSIVSPITLWYCYLIETNNRFVSWFLSWLLHYIPAYVVDGIISVFKLKKPKELKSLVHVYSKYDKLLSVFSFFTTHEWNFDDTNLVNLWRKMSDTDRNIYNFDINTIDWTHHTLMWCLGLRKYVVKDGLTGTTAAVARQKWFKLANAMILMLYVFVFWNILKFVCYVLSSIF